MAHPEGIPISIIIPDVASLGDDEMPTIAPHRDGRWSYQTKQLLVEFGTQKLDPNRGWASCVFRGIRPVIPTTSGHLNRGIRPPLFSGFEA